MAQRTETLSTADRRDRRADKAAVRIAIDAIKRAPRHWTWERIFRELERERRDCRRG